MYVLVKNELVEIYPYSIGLLRKDNPNVSFPKNPTPELLAEWGVYSVVATERPPCNSLTQSITEQTPVKQGNNWVQVWSVVDVDAQEIQARQRAIYDSIAAATQARLDEFAQTRSYSGILSLCTYATSANPKFATEGQYGVEVRDATWGVLYTILDECLAGTRPIPSGYADVEAELPPLVWPN